MSTRSSVFLSLLAWAVFLAFGSRNTQFHSSPVETPPAAPPQIVTTQSSIVLDADAILLQAHELVAKADWLATLVRQRRHLCETPWSGEATLQRGPNGCCRFESEMRLDTGASRKVFVISDGHVLAKIVPRAGGKPHIDSYPMPAEVAAKNTILERQGCGGPASVLAEARARGTNWIAQPASVGDRPGVAMTGEFRPATVDGVAPKFVRLFLDAESLWLTRGEWLNDHPDRSGKIIYEVEFLNPRLNQPLTLEECQRAFSYQTGS